MAETKSKPPNSEVAYVMTVKYLDIDFILKYHMKKRKEEEEENLYCISYVCLLNNGHPSITGTEVLFVDTGKVELSLCLTKNHAMKMDGGVQVQLHTFLSSSPKGGKWSASHPSHFTPQKKVPANHCLGAWVSPFADSVQQINLRLKS
jgi:hypothetical protein